MSTVGTKMKAIADEIRVLSGATDTLSLTEMATHVNTANTDIAEMENLIAELNAALDGKSVSGGGGGESSYTVATNTCPLCGSVNHGVYYQDGRYLWECWTCGYYKMLYW